MKGSDDFFCGSGGYPDGQDPVGVGQVGLPRFDSFEMVEERGDGGHTTATFYIGFKLKCFHMDEH
jgi:hypothetical protein